MWQNRLECLRLAFFLAGSKFVSEAGAYPSGVLDGASILIGQQPANIVVLHREMLHPGRLWTCSQMKDWPLTMKHSLCNVKMSFFNNKNVVILKILYLTKVFINVHAH